MAFTTLKAQPEDEEYLELEVRFEKETDAGLPFKVTSTSGEKSDGMFRCPFAPGEVERALDSVVRFTKKWVQRSASAEALDPLQEMGKALFQALFEGSAGDIYRKTQQNGPVRLRLVMDDPRLAELPWEYLYDNPVLRDFAALSANRSVVRQWLAPGSEPIALSPLEPSAGPLRVLYVAGEMGPMTVPGIEEEIRVLKELRHNGRMKLELIKQASAERFRNALAKGDHEVVIFAGTGATLIDPDGPRQYLHFYRGPETTDPWDRVPAKDIIAALADRKKPRLMYFSACRTDMLAKELAEVVPATIGMRGDRTDTTCVTFTSRLMKLAMQGHWLDTAVTFARREIDLVEPGSRAWGMPVFYLGTPGGLRLLSPHAAAASSDRPSVVMTAEAVAIGEVTVSRQKDAPNDKRRELDLLQTLLVVARQNVAELGDKIQKLGDKKLPSFLEEQWQATKDSAAELERKIQEL